MAQQVINVGVVANDRTGDTWRDAMVKVNDNTTELYAFAEPGASSLLSMQANATTTTIVSAGVSVLAAGTWVVESTSQGDGTTAGRYTYTGTREVTVAITGSLSVEPASGGAVTVGVRVAIDGVAIANSLRTASAAPGNPSSITVPWLVTLNTNNYVEMFVSNQDGTGDVLAASGIIRVN